MRGCKRLKNINSVSGKLGERHVDPFLTVTSVSFRGYQKLRLRVPAEFTHRSFDGQRSSSVHVTDRLVIACAKG